MRIEETNEKAVVKHGRAAGRFRALFAAALLVVAMSVGVFGVAAPAWAANCGDVLATANGVDIRSNGIWEASSTGNSCGGDAWADYNTAQTPGGTTVKTGAKWQCVEFVKRYYVQKGWISSYWTGSGSTLKDNLLGGLTFMANGSITSIMVGDVVTLNYSTFGHAGVVCAVNGSTVTIANQNGGSGLWGTATYNSATKTLTSEYSGYTTQGVIHASANGGSPPPIGNPAAHSDVDNNFGADLLLMTNEGVNGSKGFVSLSTYESFLSPQQWWNGSPYYWPGVTPLVGDMTGDHKADLVYLTNEGAGGTKVFVAASNGSGFNAPVQWLNATYWGYAGVKPMLGDVDGNGCDDLVVVVPDTVGSKGWVLFSTCSNGFLSPQLWWNGSPYGWSGITTMVGDMTGDHKADLVIMTNEGTNGTKVFVARAQTSNFAADQLWINTTWWYPGLKPSLGDVDGNGCADVVFTTNEGSNGSKAFALFSTCSNGFLSPVQVWNGSAFSWSGITPFVGDVNGDGCADYVFLTDEGTNGTKVFVASSVGGSFNSPGLWLAIPTMMYGGIKAYLK